MQVALVGQAKYVSYELQAVCVLTAQIPHHPATLTKMLSMYTINLKQSVVRGAMDVSGWLPCFGAWFCAMAVRSYIHYPYLDVMS